MINLILKRIFDFLFAFFGLIGFMPIIAVVAIIIKLTSKGPVFFRQIRVGRHSKTFRIFKFRTMVVDSGSGPKVTAQNDSRITKIGKILRSTKLDEIPQLFNVLYGTMSFVGPRPEVPELVAFYTDEHKVLLSVKPGITSPATIYHRDEEEITASSDDLMEYHKNVLIPRKAAFDLNYVNKVSIFYDIKLIILTLLSVFFNQSGYVREKTFKNRRFLIIASVVFIIVFSYVLAYFLRFEFRPPMFYIGKLKRTLPLIIMFKLTIMFFMGQLEGYWRYTNLKDVFALAKSMLIAALSMLLLEKYFLDASFPTSVVFLDFFISTSILSGQRLSMRILRGIFEPIVPKSEDNILIVGTGDRAVNILGEIRSNPDLAYNIVGFVDSESSKKGLKIQGIKILGDFDELDNLVKDFSINTIINTLDELSREEISVLTMLRSHYKVAIRHTPKASDYLTGKVRADKMQDVKIEDLLGRKSVTLDKKIIEEEFKDKIVLVTGAGGSIGSELVRQITRFAPKTLLLLDKDETLLYEIETELQETECPINTKVLMGDIRNTEKLEFFFNKYKPQIVLHAAAYKHVPLMEKHPHEAIQNNVLGTRNLLRVSDKHGVERFLMISTDKAVRSTNVMGASKRLAERFMFECIAPKSKMKCMAVRFGNVLGSRGSVIPLFRRQIARGGPVKVTHPEINRFFMSIPEAAQLVLQTSAMSNGGEIFILKMGEPVLIKDLAERLIEFSGYIPGVDIEIEYTGLRPGEKLYEELLADLEGAVTTKHDKILVINKTNEYNSIIVEKLQEVETNLYSMTTGDVRDFLVSLVDDYVPFKAIT